MRNHIDLAEPASFGVNVRQNVVLASFTTMKVGGPADYFATVQSIDEFVNLVCWARENSLPYLLVGGGSNILIADAGVRGLVINNRCRDVQILVQGEEASSANADRSILTAESGASMAGVARMAVNAALKGLEWAVSVPGTVGGAVVGNAGAHGGEVKDNLNHASVLDESGQVTEHKLADFDYAYRTSSLKRLFNSVTDEEGRASRQNIIKAGFKPVILTASFDLERGKLSQIKERASSYLQHRRQTQPVEPSLGSTFVNPQNDYAGRLIEEAGLKNLCVGGAQISNIHANFIINPGGVGSATATDVIRLIRQVQETVEQQSGIILEPEVQLVGDWPVGQELFA